jgi:hypothetical protein
MFKLVILANVKKKQQGAGVVHYLEKVAIGNAMEIGGQTTVVTRDTHASLKSNLGLIGSQVLSAAEKSLGRAQQVARSGTLLVFDAHGIGLQHGRHVDMVFRHVIWVDARTGHLGAVVWLLEKAGSQGYAIAADHFVFLPPNFREDRELHVDADEFLLGVPGPNAFAIVSLPPGKAYKFHAELKRVAAAAKLTSSTVERLANELARAMDPSRAAAAR